MSATLKWPTGGSLRAFGVGLGLLIAGLGVCVAAFVITTRAPVVAPLDVSQTVVDRDGRLLRAYTTTSGRWRLPTKTNDVSPRYLAMLRAFEDRRFETHVGVDVRALGRAVAQRLWNGRVISGGSTLTMQVVRLMTGEHHRSIAGKLRQIAQAIQLERRLTKAEILERYLHLAPFGGNIEGVRAASLSYFGREPSRLSIAEAALLVALPQSPERRRPDRSAAAAQSARNHVIDIAVTRGVISKAEATRAKQQPVPRRRIAFPMLAPHVADALKAATPEARVLRTTLDRRVQARLEALAKTSAQRHDPRVSVAILAADHTTGEIVARVGSRAFLDAVSLGAVDMSRAIRSPGSTLKPLIYALGMDRGVIHSDTLINDLPTRFGAYAPRNFSDEYRGTVTIREALAASLNIPAVKVLDAIGPGHLVGRMTRSGLATKLPDGVAPNLAVGLGGIGIDLHNLVALYSALASDGVPVALCVTPQRTCSNDATQKTPERLVSADAAHAITAILRDAPPPPNARTGRVAFKTGTSYGHRDAWAVGYDGRHVIGVWIGRADASATPGLIGRTAASPILFDAFHAVAAKRTPFSPTVQKQRRFAAGDLPPPLKRFDADRNANVSAGFIDPPVRIVFPPDRSELAVVGPGTNGGGVVVLKAEGGRLPLTWLADGAPIAQGARGGRARVGRQIIFTPPTSGFVQLTVVDADGRVARSTVRISE
ncbi:MAG: penicillin-binding protein 1C [Pseudomonadota bacterium]